MNKVSVVVYGAETICASCVNAPTSQNIYEWLQPLLKRKYPSIHFEFTYIDIEQDTENLSDHDQQFIERLQDEELFYPLVTMNDEYVADGYIQLKDIKRFMKDRFPEVEDD
ncbi:YuzD family protein [Staphylococcus sp. SQ8-PEA]|uniref:YuzD family protein n=1 Tax=Staphylococcus marylandisciuri TaxID=2981529 RepID=A0ABT2QPN5_9STAP|nr:YuzD family protein [Staphylococcus marylandisciuri]MCU5745939.1 YuzD family protein [Staphylococcus marylandisciuri]